MRNFSKIISVLLTTSILSFGPFISSVHADWPQFQLNPDHNGYNSSETVLTPPLTQLWSVTLDSTPVGYPGMVEANNTIYEKSLNGTLHSINATTGQTNWTKSTVAAGAVIVSGNTVYASNDCNNCTIDAFNTTTGDLLWSTEPNGGTVALTIDNGVIYAGNGHNVSAYDASTGNIIWTTPVNDGVTDAPTVDNGVVYSTTFGGGTYAMDASTGSIIWSNFNFGGVIFSSPTYNDGVLYLGSGNGEVYALNASNGSEKWQASTMDSTWNTPVVANGKVYSASLYGQVVALNASDGSQAWQYVPPSRDGEQGISPAVANGIVYVGLSDDKLHAFDAYTGNEIWNFQAGGVVGSPIVSDNKVFFTSSDGKLYAFQNQTPLAINAGGNTEGTYEADTDYTGGQAYNTNASIDTSGVTNPAPEAVYQSVRYGNFSYTIPNLTANASYTLQLQFSEPYWGTAQASGGGVGSRIFNVSVNGTQALSNFDVYEAAGGANKAIMEQIPATADSNGNITIQFSSVVDNAMVSGIAVENGTLPSPTPTPTPTPVNSLAISAGGQGSGDYVADTDYTGGQAYNTSATIDTSNVTNPAPQAVYQAVRYGNFSYTIPTYSPNTNYTVRLDFEEPYWNAAGQRLFNVAINGTQVLSNFDVFQEAGGENKAISETFTTTSDSNGLIHIQFTTDTDNAMVSGIQISQQ